MIGETIVGYDPVELASRLIILPGPIFAAIESHSCTTVISADHDFIVGRVNPEVMMIAVRGAHGCVGPAAVNRF